MADQKKPDAPTSESTEEKTELTSGELEMVSGGILLTPTNTSTVTGSPTIATAITTPLPGTTVM